MPDGAILSPQTRHSQAPIGGSLEWRWCQWASKCTYCTLSALFVDIHCSNIIGKIGSVIQDISQDICLYWRWSPRSLRSTNIKPRSAHNSWVRSSRPNLHPHMRTNFLSGVEESTWSFFCDLRRSKTPSHPTLPHLIPILYTAFA